MDKIFRCIGASNHTDKERAQLDYYATDPVAAEWLIKLEPQLKNILEPCVGGGHLANVFKKYNRLGKTADIVKRGDYCDEEQDFLKCDKKWDGDIVTNPPYSVGLEFAGKALSVIPQGRYVCMFLKLTFLEGIKRKEFFKKNPPIRIWVSSSRIKCAANGDFKSVKSSAVAYAWFVWQKGFDGEPVIKWFN